MKQRTLTGGERIDWLRLSRTRGIGPITFFHLLDRYGASFCVQDMPGSTSERFAVGPAAYVRFHGAEGKYRGRYPDELLLGWSDWILEQARSGRAVWCYFNNDIHGAAIEDARTLKSMIGQLAR